MPFRLMHRARPAVQREVNAMKLVKIDGEIAIWRMVFAALIIAVICDGVGIWMGWIAQH